MVLVTKLARIKFNSLLFTSPGLRFEREVMIEFIFEGMVHDSDYVLCSIETLSTLLNRISFFGISLVGIESGHQDSKQFISLPFEHYSSSGNPKQVNWVMEAIRPYFAREKYIWLKFFIETVKQERIRLSALTGIPLD